MGFPRILVQWDGGSLAPASRLWAGVCDKNLVVGERYWIIEDKERSTKSHDHFFALIAKAWANLPERYDHQFPGRDGAELLRKYALIKAGYHHMKTVVFQTHEEAARAAALVENHADPERYTIADVNGCVVSIFWAESQRRMVMGADRFQQSKQAVLEIVAEMAGVTVEELVATTGQAE